MVLLTVDNGKIRKAESIQAAEKIIEMRQKRGIWDVIDELIKIWAKIAPDEEQAVKMNIADYRENLNDRKFGQTVGGKHMDRRFTLAFPRSLMLMIRSQYKADELPMDKKFFFEFARRYPAFQIPEKL